MGSTNRPVRSFAAWLLFSYACLLFVFRADDKPITSTDSGEAVADSDEHFTLCNKKIFLKNMPIALNSTERPFGVYNWKRSLDNAILLEHRTERVYMYGRTGNQIRELFHAFDMARDRGGALVMHEDGFPIDLALRSLFLGIDRTELENRFGITFIDSVEEKYRSKMKTMTQEPLYHYISNDTNYNLFDAMEHRHYLIQELYRMTSREMELHPDSSGVADMCASLHSLFGKGDGQRNALKELGITKDITQNYTVIHSRSLEGFGKKFIARAHLEFGVDQHAPMDYPADLISSIIAPLGMDKSSVLMITDEQNRGVAQRLATDDAIGPVFTVVPKEVSTIKGDMMLAILSDCFIGNPISTFSQFIVQVRYALGIGNSYLFYKKDKDEKWETFCNDEQCFYYWINLWTSLF